MSTTSVEPKNMTDEALILSETDGHVGIIRLNRPKVLNALNPALMTQLDSFHTDALHPDGSSRPA